MSYNKHDFDVVLTKNPIASGGHSPPASEIHFCVQTPQIPLSENPGSTPVACNNICFQKSGDMVNKNTLGVKKCEAN